jgi:hypothetical protein
MMPGALHAAWKGDFSHLWLPSSKVLRHPFDNTVNLPVLLLNLGKRGSVPGAIDGWEL